MCIKYIYICVKIDKNMFSDSSGNTIVAVKRSYDTIFVVERSYDTIFVVKRSYNTLLILMIFKDTLRRPVMILCFDYYYLSSYEIRINHTSFKHIAPILF